MTAEIVKADESAVAVAVMSADDARALTDKIRQTLQVAYDLIADAWRGGAWVALGYKTWDAYCSSEFAEARMVRLPASQRREVVAELRAEGMSTRAIASGTGVDQATVVRDLQATDASASVETVTSLDGRKRPARRPKAPAAPQAKPPRVGTKAYWTQESKYHAQPFAVVRYHGAISQAHEALIALEEIPLKYVPADKRERLLAGLDNLVERVAKARAALADES